MEENKTNNKKKTVIPKAMSKSGNRKTKEIPQLPELTDKVMKEGDLVIGYFNPNTQILFTLKKGKIQDTKYGHYPHISLIGKKFSSKVN